MKFTYPEADFSKVIKSFTHDEGLFCIEYLDGSVSKYLCSDPEKVEMIKSLMLSQARERQEKMWNNHTDKLARTMILYQQMIFAFGLQHSIRTKSDFLMFLCAFMLSINLFFQASDLKSLIELKKYQLFFEMYNDLDEVNKSEFLKCIEADTIYQTPLDIDTIDDYTYGEVKTLYRKLMQEKTKL